VKFRILATFLLAVVLAGLYLASDSGQSQGQDLSSSAQPMDSVSPSQSANDAALRSLKID